MVEADKVPVIVKFPERVSEVFLKGVYPNAEVMSDDDNENEAVKLDKPSLVRVSVFMVEAESEKEIPVT